MTGPVDRSPHYLIGQIESVLSRESWDDRTDTERVDRAVELIAEWDAAWTAHREATAAQ